MHTAQMFCGGINTPATSPWRVLVVVVSEIIRNADHIDYDQTIHKVTLLDAYPLPHLQTVANSVAQCNWFSSLDLKSAYHQVPILPEESVFTAFEANGQLCQFKSIPIELKNAVPSFQRVVN